MKQKLILFCTAGLITANLCLPAVAVSLANARPNLLETANPAVAAPSYYAPDEKGCVSFQNVAARVRTNNLTILSLQATLDSQKAFNREKAYKDMVDGINGMAEFAWLESSLGKEISSIQANIESMRDQLENLKEENYAETMERLTRQIEHAIDQVIVGSESLYLNSLTYEVNLSDMKRALTTLERSITEMELRSQLGQVSPLSLQQLKANYNSTKSQAASMELALQKMKASLQSLLGETPTGEITLLPLDLGKQQDLFTLGYDEALKKAKESSYTLYAAKETLEDAEETWKDAKDDYSSISYKYKMAEQTYMAAVYTHQNTVKSFELSFRTLYDAVPDAKLALAAAEQALAFQEKAYTTAEAKHKLGQISDNGLLNAKEELEKSHSAVTIAKINAFTAMNNYKWAVLQGYVG